MVIAIPALILLFSRIARYYDDVGREIGLGAIPDPPQVHNSLILVMVTAVSRMTQAALGTALSLDGEVVAVSVQFDDERARALRSDWNRWNPGVRLVILNSDSRSIAAPMLRYLGLPEIRDRRVMILIPEVEPRKLRHQLLQNQRGIVLANVLRRRSHVIVARMPFRLRQD